jgi:hypothetical protein
MVGGREGWREFFSMAAMEKCYKKVMNNSGKME